jgi:thiol-disulfide isomerase/thioredoxin
MALAQWKHSRSCVRKSSRSGRLAIIKPTPENLKAYIVAQEALMDRASVFSDVWRRVIWANPELNYQLRNPSNNAAIQVRDSQRNKRKGETLAALAKEWGLFFIFRSDCPYCHRLAPTLKFLSEQYGITVFPVSLDGGGLPEFPRPAAGQRDGGSAGSDRWCRWSCSATSRIDGCCPSAPASSRRRRSSSASTS